VRVVNARVEIVSFCQVREEEMMDIVLPEVSLKRFIY